ncbi:hypothetical protein D0N41_22510 [Bacillus subtilis KCTC 1028 = ATCC 6051a]|nr:hypothetical protein [Bacillus subtilis]RFP77525.1 hypothetical protein D0N41_22510 [Bacillus subtilis KCTC 1028 = ATCC 6051a]
MPKVKFLQSAYLPSHKTVFNHNEVVEIENKDLAKSLVKNGHAEEVKETKKRQKRTQSCRKT